MTEGYFTYYKQEDAESLLPLIEAAERSFQEDTGGHWPKTEFKLEQVHMPAGVEHCWVIRSERDGKLNGYYDADAKWPKTYWTKFHVYRSN